MDSSNYIKANNKIKESDNILLVTHDRPDPDGISSLCALAEYINLLEKKITLFCLHEPPSQLWFLPHIEKIITDKGKFRFDEFDLVVAVDCGSSRRTNLQKEIKSRSNSQYVIEFDHHPKVEDYANLEIRDDMKSSTTEVLYHFFKINQIRITKSIATCILTGVLGDTGVFLYPSTSNQTMQIASEMVARGAKMPQVNRAISANKSLAGMKVWGKALNSLETNSKYNLAYAVLTQEDMAGSGITDEDLEGIAGFLSNLHGINGLIMLREEEGGILRGSLRSNSDGADMSLLAMFLGGGGHARAAGFKIEGKIERMDSGSWKII